MKLIETKFVKVGDNDFPIRLTNRAMIEFQQLSGGIDTFDSLEKMSMFFYCTAKAGARAENKVFKYTYEQFLDLIDDYFAEFMTNFTAAISEPEENAKPKKKTSVK